MLFLVDTHGVPSVARWVKVQRGGSFVVQSGQAARWGADVWLGRDFDVQAGGRLTILPGTTVHADAKAPSQVKITVEGQVLAQGTTQQPIHFRSMNGTGAAGEWYGLVFNLTGAEGTSYGYLGCSQPTSHLDHVKIDGAQVGIEIDNQCAPAIASLSVTNPGKVPGSNPGADAGIYVKETDLELQMGWWKTSGTGCTPQQPCFITDPAHWDLTGPLNVVVSNSVPSGSGRDLGVGEPGVVDLVPRARLATTGDASDQVVFRPLVISTNNESGADWAGISLDDHFKHSIDYADVGYAINPVFMFMADSSTVVRHSRIHHFRDVGVWVDGSKGVGGVITANLIERGSGLAPSAGNEGIFSDWADQLTVTSNTLDLSGSPQLQATGQYGAIHVHQGKTFCQTTPPSQVTVLLQSNVIKGNSASSSDPGTRSGIWLDWVCGGSLRKFNVLQNTVAQWNFAGLRFDQSADVQISCNRVENSHAAVVVSRDGEPVGVSLRFRDNLFDVVANLDARGTFVTDNAVYAKLGGSVGQGDRGNNQLIARLGHKAVLENDEIPANPPNPDVLNAQRNSWLLNGVLQTTDPTIVAIIGTEVSTGPDVDHSNFLTEDPPAIPTCMPPAVPGSAAPPIARQQHVADDEGRQAATSAERVAVDAPERSTLAGISPNPMRGRISMELGVGHGDGGVHAVTVYDVGGRRVRDLLHSDLLPGWYRLSWDGRDASGGRLPAGVYFVRAVGPKASTVRKLVLLE